ncbi:TPA: conjugal transfer protein TraF [Legionella pneumophila]|nr:conjugal transfer protein TraF [Legionella pneumophila]HBD7410338.1 conjugal transfer protein TraF [Legionella pneumophila]HBD9405531.1 conjugal transfer protein TraF [Legionella pneumophila]HBI2968760.1 conjugal transfer protein TraF [Legionella pneumophila]
MKIKWIALFLSGILCTFTVFAGNTESFEAIAKKQGFFFFYSSSCPHCQRFAPVLQAFSKRYGFKVLAISADGGFLPDFPDAVMDEGQLRNFEVTVFPSLFLVNPANHSASLVTEGNIDEAELSRRILKILDVQSGKVQI